MKLPGRIEQQKRLQTREEWQREADRLNEYHAEAKTGAMVKVIAVTTYKLITIQSADGEAFDTLTEDEKLAYRKLIAENAGKAMPSIQQVKGGNK